jgi:predicted ATPase/DNA-binding transcriptional ArsR family regulator
MGDLVMERRISHLRKAVDDAQNPSPRLVYELMQALMESGDRRGAIEAYRRFERNGNLLTAELIAAYNSALWSEPRELPTNLPKPRHPFVGRISELNNLAEAIRSHGAAQVVGPGGMGKTRLALETARRSVADFPDGVWWVDLSATHEVEALCVRIAHAMRLEDRTYTPEELAARIGEAQTLIVLDCCENCVEPATNFADLLADRCANAALIATSRVQLSVKRGPALKLHALSLPQDRVTRMTAASSDAVRLFLERAVDADPDFVMNEEHAALAAEICRKVGALPLGIELACAYLAHINIREVRDRLAHSRLNDVSDTLSGTIRWTYELLEPADRALLRALSTFDYPFTLDDATALSGTPDARSGLDRLTRASIIVSERAHGLTWYRLLDTTRAFAREEAEKHAETPLLRRHLVERMRDVAADYETRLAAGDELAAKQLTGAHGNLVSALEIAAITPTLAEHGLRIVGAVGMQLGVVGLAAPTIGHVERSIESARRFARDRSPLFDAALEAYAWLANRLSFAAKAVEINEERIARARRTNDVCKIARALATSVIACVNLGNYDRAREIAVEAVNRSRECGEVSTRARALRSLASFYLNMNETASALPLYEEFFGLDEAQIPPMQVSMALHDYGFALRASGDGPRARALLEKCVERALAITDYSTAAHAYQTLGQLSLDDSDCNSALKHFRLAIDLGGKGINIRTQLDTLEDVVCASICEEQLEQLAFVLGFVDAGREKIGFKVSPEFTDRIHLIRNVVRSRLSVSAFNQATMRGRLSSMDEVVEVVRSLNAGTEPPRQADRFAVLTKREREIAELAARGLTNRAIAETLSVSVRTVDVHLASIFRKLSIERREQILS